MSTISLVHEGPVSQEHLENMCITAQAVQDIVKAKGSKRREAKKRDRFGAKPKVYPNSIGGSKNMLKAGDYWGEAYDRSDERFRKISGPKGRLTGHQLSLVALHADRDGQYPFRVTVPQSVPRCTDLLIKQVTEANATDPVLASMRPIQVIDFTEHRRHVERRPTVVIDRGPVNISPTILVQKVYGEAKATPKSKAIEAERHSRGQYNVRPYSLNR